MVFFIRHEVAPHFRKKVKDLDFLSDRSRFAAFTRAVVLGWVNVKNIFPVGTFGVKGTIARGLECRVRVEILPCRSFFLCDNYH